MYWVRMLHQTHTEINKDVLTLTSHTLEKKIRRNRVNQNLNLYIAFML